MTSFNPDHLIEQLRTTPRAIRALIENMSADHARWKPDAEHWSVLEIVNHLADEETRDFAARLRSTLEDPSRQWAGIDPPAWAIDEDYNSRDLAESLARFETARAASLDWLKTLQQPGWNNVYTHPSLGDIRAGDLLAAWAIHDLLHLRQLTKRCFQLAQQASDGFSTRYAGEWTA